MWCICNILVYQGSTKLMPTEKQQWLKKYDTYYAATEYIENTTEKELNN